MIYQFSNSIDRYHYHFSIYDNFNYVTHFHDYFEIIYVISGEILITAGNKTQTLTSDKIALILPNELHSFTTPNHSVTWVALFSRDLVSHFSNTVKNKTSDTFHFTCPNDLKNYFSNSMTKLTIDDIYNLKAFLYTLCGLYIKNVKLISKPDRIDTSPIHKILEYLATHLNERTTLKQLAAKFGYNANYLSRTFNKTMGMSFNTFLNEMRIEQAKALLSETEFNIADIAYESGFESIRNFNRVFKNAIGITPREYKNKRPII